MTQPHILFILVDQMRPDAIGRATPNLNALAARGVKFENCYCASPLCSPSRNSIVTGKFPTGHGVCGNMGDPISPAERRDTYPNHLQQMGYHTAYIGKHHFIDRYGLGVDLVADDEIVKGYGYDHVWQVGDVVEARHNADRFTHHLEERSKLDAYRKQLSADYIRNSAHDETQDGYITDCAVRYLADYDVKKPLFLTVGLLSPHGPYWAPEPFASKFNPEEMAAPVGVTGRSRTGSDAYASADLGQEAALDSAAAIARVRKQRADYLDLVAFLDHQVGRLLAALKEKGVLENTLVVFTSDHGVNLGDHGIGGKRYYYEQSTRVPLIMAGPGIPLDKRVGWTSQRALVSGVDLYPTFLDAAGCAEIRGHGQREGLSLLQLLQGTCQPRTTVFSELGTTMMVRDANWKLVYDPEQGGVQYLFNLRRDPGEVDNLTGLPEYRLKEADLVELMLSRLIRLTHFTHAKEQINLQRVRV